MAGTTSFYSCALRAHRLAAVHLRLLLLLLLLLLLMLLLLFLLLLLLLLVLWKLNLAQSNLCGW